MSIDKKEFMHTDGRKFRYVGTQPHTTRDGRAVTLYTWEACCSSPGCSTRITAGTMTPRPWSWSAFRPAQFCQTHRAEVRKAAQVHFVRARAEGLKKWRESPEGKAAMAQRKRAIWGSVERTLHDQVTAADGAMDVEELKRTIAGSLPAPTDGKRDTRLFRVARAVGGLIDKGHLVLQDGMVSPPSATKQTACKYEARTQHLKNYLRDHAHKPDFTPLDVVEMMISYDDEHNIDSAGLSTYQVKTGVTDMGLVEDHKREHRRTLTAPATKPAAPASKPATPASKPAGSLEYLANGYPVGFDLSKFTREDGTADIEAEQAALEKLEGAEYPARERERVRIMTEDTAQVEELDDLVG